MPTRCIIISHAIHLDPAIPLPESIISNATLFPHSLNAAEDALALLQCLYPDSKGKGSHEKVVIFTLVSIHT